MSRSSRQRDSLTPSLFPFLAVLLCTMGALVLILMLVVSGAQASALQIAEQSVEQAEEVESQLKLASHSFQKQLTEAQIDLEKKRLGLQHLENHIQELLTELEQLRRTAELADADEKSDEDNQQAQEEAISELERQLLEAHDKLKQKLDKPEGDKPIFAIVPYDGPNGTHRRPIYLECTEQGIRIQPEGVLLQVADLEPPYGPGNPLDAALRTIRAQYAPANHAVTSTAYPLLVVRPSGIRSYAMARAAMSGWDDQFGYELVGEEVDLAFPEGDPGLTTKITQALDLARERQAALIVAMPQKYRGFSERDRPLSGGSGGSGNAEYGSGEYSAEQSGAGVYAGNAAAQAGSGTGNRSAGGRGGWANENFDGSSSSGSGDDLQTQPSAGARASSTDSMLGFGGPAASATTGASEAGVTGQLAAGDSFFGTASGPNNPASGSYGPGSGYGSASDSSRRESGGSMSVGASGQPSSDGLAAAGSAGSPDGRQGDSGNSSASGGSPTSAARGSSSGAAGGSSGGAQMSSQPPSDSQMAMPFKTPGQSGGGSQASSSGSSASSAGNTSGSSQSGSSGSSSQSSADASDQQGMPQLSLNKTFNGQKQESAAPVASRRGRGWAWSQGPRTQTPVGRSIRMMCLEDRWIVLPDSGKASDPAAIAIPFDNTPQQRAEMLAKVVAERVDSWGLALTGGYWKPTLLVDVGPDAEWRFNQLQQLLDASGLEVQRGK